MTERTLVMADGKQFSIQVNVTPIGQVEMGGGQLAIEGSAKRSKTMK